MDEDARAGRKVFVGNITEVSSTRPLLTEKFVISTIKSGNFVTDFGENNFFPQKSCCTPDVFSW
jgi:hypothetical protein